MILGFYDSGTLSGTLHVTEETGGGGVYGLRARSSRWRIHHAGARALALVDGAFITPDREVAARALQSMVSRGTGVTR